MICSVRSRYALAVLLSLLCLAMQTPRTDNIDRLVQTDTPFTPVYKVYRKSHALLIGINKYKNRPKSAQLAYADNDVAELKQVLIDHYGFEPQNVVTLLDEQATFDAIHRALAALSNPRMVDKEDRVLVFFAGHGKTIPLPDNGGPMGFLIPYDADALDPDRPDDPTPYQSSCLPMDFIWTQLKSSPAKHILLLADACYSGLLAKSRAEGDIAPQLLSVWSNMRAMEVITGGSAGETTVELESKRHGAFTHQLLEALRARSAATGSVFTTTSLFASLQASVPNLVASVSNGRKTQTPQMGKYLGTEGEFLFIPTGLNSPADPIVPVVEPPTVTELGTQAELVITSEPAGATVTIDDEERGKTPLKMTLELGLKAKRTVQIGIGGLPGYKDQLFTMDALRGKSVTVPMRHLFAIAGTPVGGSNGSLSSQPKKLARTYKEGDNAHYKQTIKVNVMGMDIVLTSTEKITVKEVKKTGEVVELREGEGGTMTLNGVDQPAAPAPPVTITYDKSGKLSDYKPSMDVTLFDPGVAYLVAVAHHFVLPNKAVKKDDTWETELDDPAVKGKKMTVKDTCLGMEKRDGKDLWKIKQTGEPLVDEAGGKMTFEIIGLLDPATGQLVHSEGALKQIPTTQLGTMDWIEESNLL